MEIESDRRDFHYRLRWTTHRCTPPISFFISAHGIEPIALIQRMKVSLRVLQDWVCKITRARSSLRKHHRIIIAYFHYRPARPCSWALDQLSHVRRHVPSFARLGFTCGHTSILGQLRHVRGSLQFPPSSAMFVERQMQSSLASHVAWPFILGWNTLRFVELSSQPKGINRPPFRSSG